MSLAEIEISAALMASSYECKEMVCMGCESETLRIFAAMWADRQLHEPPSAYYVKDAELVGCWGIPILRYPAFRAGR